MWDAIGRALCTLCTQLHLELCWNCSGVVQIAPVYSYASGTEASVCTGVCWFCALIRMNVLPESANHRQCERATEREAKIVTNTLLEVDQSASASVLWAH